MRFLLLLMLASCTRIELDGPDEQDYRWQRDGQKGTPIIHKDMNVFMACAFEEHALSCSIIRNGECHIYLPRDPAPWLEAHERKHCDGWRHPNNLRW